MKTALPQFGQNDRSAFTLRRQALQIIRRHSKRGGVRHVSDRCQMGVRHLSDTDHTAEFRRDFLDRQLKLLRRVSDRCLTPKTDT